MCAACNIVGNTVPCMHAWMASGIGGNKYTLYRGPATPKNPIQDCTIFEI